jgi:hypothetical protein
MFTLLRTVSLRRLLIEQAPTLGVSLAIAELFYKFHSFLLEACAFLVTWYALDGVRYLVAGMVRIPAIVIAQSGHRDR